MTRDQAMSDHFEYKVSGSPPRTIDAHAQEFASRVFADLTGFENFANF